MAALAPSRTLAAIAGATAVLVLSPGHAGVTVYEGGAEQVALGGRVQAQYQRSDPEGADASDTFRIRRAWLTVDATVTPDWQGRLQFQLDGGLSTKDAKIQYTGWSIGTVTVGNFYVPFSREELTSTKRQQLVEKTPLAGTGTPGRGIGVSLRGGRPAWHWHAGLWEIGLASDPATIAFASQVDGAQDSEGKLVGGRIELHPAGDVGFAQGNLAGQSAWEIAFNGFAWANDDDRVTDPALDYDNVTGWGIDGAWRHGGWSIDAGYNRFDAATLGSGVDQGIVEAGEASVATASIEGGYLVGASHWEIVAGVAAEDAEAWAETQTEAGVGVNRFFNGHSNKLQVSLVATSDAGGTAGNDRNDLYVQLQHAF